MVPKRILFVSWEGPQTFYLRTVFLPLFRELNNRGYFIHVLNFTWGNSPKPTSILHETDESNITIREINVWKTPKGIEALFIPLAATRAVISAATEWKIDLLVARSIIPAFIVLLTHKRLGLPIIYDSDGLPVDERLDFSPHKSSKVVAFVLRLIEFAILNHAKVVLSRTVEGSETLRARAGSSSEEAKFRLAQYPLIGQELNKSLIPKKSPPRKSGALEFCYLGSIGLQYRVGEILDLVVNLREKGLDASLAVFTRDVGRLVELMESRGLAAPSWVKVEELQRASLHQRLAQFDAGFSFRQVHFSTRGVSPLKINDYLLAGLPVIGNVFSPLQRKLVEEGVFLESDGTDVEKILAWLEQQATVGRQAFAELASRSVQRHFSFERGIQHFEEAFRHAFRIEDKIE